MGTIGGAATNGGAERTVDRAILRKSVKRPEHILCKIVAVAIAVASAGTAGCLCRHRYAMDAYPKTAGEPARTFAGEIDELERECASGRRAEVGLCEKNGREFAWFEQGGVVWRNRWAYDAKDGALAFVEHRSWTDVGPPCFPDAVNTWGVSPPCSPVFMPACGALDELRSRFVHAP
jgi:hypothetical protein